MNKKLTKLLLNSFLLTLLLAIVAVPAGTVMLLKYKQAPAVGTSTGNQVLSTQDVRESTQSSTILEEEDR